MDPAVATEKAPSEPVEVSLAVAVEKKAPEPAPVVSVVEKKVEEKKTETTEESEFSDYNPTGSTFMSSVLNMTNTIIGAGTLSLPSTIFDGGIIGAGLLLVVSLVLSLFGAHYLVTAAVYTKEDSYGFIGRKAVNPTVGYLADIFMILFDFGISVGYLNISFGQTVDLISNLFNVPWDTVNANKWVCLFLAFHCSGSP